MKCLGCYKETESSYCRQCSKKLFGMASMSSVLTFDAPKAENIKEYQEHTKSLSISGVQLKYSLKLENNLLLITETHGEYILKPIPPAKFIALPELVPENEHLTMQLAEKIFGIETAANALIYFADGQPAYITRRFDRQKEGKKILQEDFAQLTQRSNASHGANYKYEGTYEEMGRLIKKYVAAYLPETEKFFSIILFNYLISNGDAHLKNFSLTRKESGEYALTPAYDLMCTRLHTPSEQDIALDLYAGEMNTPYYNEYGCYGREDFMELAAALGLRATRAKRIIDKYVSLQQAAINYIQTSFLTDKQLEMYVELLREKVSRFTV